MLCYKHVLEKIFNSSFEAADATMKCSENLSKSKSTSNDKTLPESKKTSCIEKCQTLESQEVFEKEAGKH